MEITDRQKNSIELVKKYETYKQMGASLREGKNGIVEVVFTNSKKEEFIFSITTDGSIYYLKGM